jgi:hypothetical protein
VPRAQEALAEDPDPAGVEAVERTDGGNAIGHVDIVKEILDSVNVVVAGSATGRAI